MIDRYSRKELKHLWSDEVRFQNMLRVELASTHAFCQLHVIPEEDYLCMKNNATFEVERIREIEEITHHDTIAFTKAVAESLGEEAKWLHYGLTSTDVVDTALGYTLKQVNAILEEDLNRFLYVVKQKALMYKYTPCIGRTHGMHAEITSFGLKWALWYDEIQRDIERFHQARKRVEVGKISGAVGNFANIPPIIEEMVCQELGIEYAPISSQVLSRDRHTEYIYSLSQIASTIEKIATEIRHLSRSEVKEVEEYFREGQKGSSAMPHKRNPIASENMCGVARVVRSYLHVAFDDNVLWHERDISHSSAERIILADASTLVDYMLNRYAKVLDTLTVFENKMLENIHLTHGCIFSGRVVNALVEKGIDRSEAYDWVQSRAMLALETNDDLLHCLKDTEVSTILGKTLETCFDIEYYLKGVNRIYKRLGLES